MMSRASKKCCSGLSLTSAGKMEVWLRASRRASYPMQGTSKEEVLEAGRPERRNELGTPGTVIALLKKTLG